MMRVEDFSAVASERFTAELMKAMAGDDPSVFVTTLMDAGVFQIYFPEFDEMVGMTQPVEHHEYDVYTHSIEALRHATLLTSDPVLRLAALLHDIGKPATATVREDGVTPFFPAHNVRGAEIVTERLYSLKFPKQTIDRVSKLVRYHMLCYDETWTDKQIKKLSKKVNVIELVIIRRADDYAKGRGISTRYTELTSLVARYIRIRNQPMQVTDLKINGHDVMSFGYTGEHVGGILRDLLEYVLEDPSLNNREWLLAAVRDA